MAVATLCVAAACASGMRRLSFDTDVLSLLPREGEAIPAFRTFVREFGGVDQLYVLFTAPEGHSVADYENAIGAWTEKLRAVPEITQLDTGLSDPARDLRWLADRQLLLFSPGSMREALARFRPGGMRDALAARRELLALPSPRVADLVQQDPLGLFELLQQEVGGRQSGLHLGFAPDGYATADGRSRIVIATPARPPYDTDFSRALLSRLESLRGELARLAGDAMPPLNVQFAGGHAIALETEGLIRRETIRNTTGALVLLLPLLWIVFRSLWLVLAGPLPSVVSLVVVLGVLGWTGATLSAAATAAAAMLFGLAVDGVVLLYAAYALALARGAQPGAAVDGTAGPAFSMLLGMWTTAATFYGLAWVDFPSLEQLGTLIGHSMLACGLFTLLLVPALLPRRRPERPLRALAMPRLADWIERHRRAILLAAIVATVILGAAALGLRVNPTLDRLRSVTPGAKLLERIGPAFGRPADAAVVVAQGRDLEGLLAANERLVERIGTHMPGVAVQAASKLLPSQATQDRRAAVLRASGLSASEVESALVEEAKTQGFREGTFAPFRERIPDLVEHSQRITYDGFAEHGLGDLIGRFVARPGDDWLVVSYMFAEAPPQLETLAGIVRSTEGAGTLTGLAFVNRELAERFVPEFLKGLAIGSAIVVALVVFAFRSWRLSMLALTPTVIGLVWAAGVLAIMRIELDLFAVFAVVTFVGIGVDYGIHLVHRSRERGDARRAVEELAPVILVAAAITLVGYGTLISSSYPPLRSIGVVAAVSVFTLALASVVVLPAMLGRHRRAV